MNGGATPSRYYLKLLILKVFPLCHEWGSYSESLLFEAADIEVSAKMKNDIKVGPNNPRDGVTADEKVAIVDVLPAPEVAANDKAGLQHPTVAVIVMEAEAFLFSSSLISVGHMKQILFSSA
ncbi:hypothetical protein B296_00031404 [Ensete ventricosum]|uniref:Uncharacterized protein n=1 Tax=Ensete ventricosum TaxID=4639 RepID=A0A427AD08_ENSVE|nr:hypothetical protein B296_00031404 [Ensete ventricosum]